jgi:hypothetical protein
VSGNVSLGVCTDARHVSCGFQAGLITSGGGSALFDGDGGGDGGGSVVMRAEMAVIRLQQHLHVYPKDLKNT